MKTKIDISSLDDATKDKIAAIQKRCVELSNGQEITVNLPITIGYGWYDGENAVVHEWGSAPKYEINWEIVKKHEEDIQKKLDSEVKDIIDFSNSIADRLGVDRDDFFEFLCL